MIASLISRTASGLTRQTNRLMQMQLINRVKPITVSSFSIQKADLSLSSCTFNNTKADVDLHKFLVEEIKSEKEISQPPKKGKLIAGFDMKTDGAQITLSRRHNNEQITVRFNVNESVSDGAQEFSESAEERPEEIAASMQSKPNFTVEIRKSKDVALVFECGFLEDAEEAEQSEKTDLFEIQNFYLLSNGQTTNDELSDSTYMADGSLIDGQFYDLLMDYLDERGIGFEFAENLVDYATYYEHEQYIGLLNRILNFVAHK